MIVNVLSFSETMTPIRDVPSSNSRITWRYFSSIVRDGSSISCNIALASRLYFFTVVVDIRADRVVQCACRLAQLMTLGTTQRGKELLALSEVPVLPDTFRDPR